MSDSVPHPDPVPVPDPGSVVGSREHFDHERLDVYRASLDFVKIASDIAATFDAGHSYLRDQLRRAASSIVLNIAEGAGEFRRGEKARIYRIALRSATECSAILDIAATIMGVHRGRDRGEPRVLLLRIVAMLTRMTIEDRGRERGRDGGRA